MVKIHVNKHLVEVSENPASGAQILKAAGYDPAGYDLFELQGEGDPSGGKKIGPDTEVELKDGDHFRAVPNNVTFG